MYYSIHSNDAISIQFYLATYIASIDHNNSDKLKMATIQDTDKEVTDGHTLCEKVYSQLDAKWIKDEKDGNMKRKYRERARSYVRNLHKGRLVPFIIDTSDLTGRVAEEYINLEDDSAWDYVTTDVVCRIFDSIGKPYVRVRVRDFVKWKISGS